MNRFTFKHSSDHHVLFCDDPFSHLAIDASSCTSTSLCNSVSSCNTVLLLATLLMLVIKLLNALINF